MAIEDLARSQISDILIICIGEEKRLALEELNRPNAALSTQLLALSTTPSPDPAPLYLQFETKLNRLVTYKKERRLLQGIADYSLWYDKDEPRGINLVIIEAQREGILSMTDGQLVAYMGEYITFSSAYGTGLLLSHVQVLCTEQERTKASRTSLCMGSVQTAMSFNFGVWMTQAR